MAVDGEQRSGDEIPGRYPGCDESCGEETNARFQAAIRIRSETNR